MPRGLGRWLDQRRFGVLMTVSREMRSASSRSANRMMFGSAAKDRAAGCIAAQTTLTRPDIHQKTAQDGARQDCCRRGATADHTDQDPRSSAGLVLVILQTRRTRQRE